MKKARTRVLLGMALAFTMILTVSSAWAMTGDEVLKKSEDAMNAPQDREADLTMTLVDKDGKKKERTLKIFQKGEDLRLIRFLAPADVEGVGFLVLSDEEMYLYMPAFGKVRRIASHVKNENFMGTDFTYDDMASTTYTEDYSAEIVEEDDTFYVLDCTPRPDSDVDYFKVKMWINKTTFMPEKVEFYKKGMKLLKVMKNSEIEQVDGYWTPKHVEMEDVIDNHKTIMEMKSIKHDQGLKDSYFSQRQLKRAR
ncbi:MAG: outer membrane lipoprotein-sorting protein [Deltaproteobacteria bacterium]|nr:outer membrane lipoprotein-sorting protein [Deltaproteobacteria bacterium]